MASNGLELPHDVDKFGGVLIKPEGLRSDPVLFANDIRHSLALWSEKKRRGVWLTLPTELCDLVPIAVKEGFAYHHASANYLMLTKWIPPTTNRIPQPPSSYIGVGGVVINEKNEILVISEKYESGVRWKIPGGLVDRGEDLPTAAVREVFEETGIKSEFVSLLCFRHRCAYLFGRLRPLSSSISKQEEEIAHCRWLSIDEYRNDPNIEVLHREIAEIAYESSLQSPPFSGCMGNHEIHSHQHDEPFYYPTERDHPTDRMYHNTTKRTAEL